jgi:hypothetical protein
MWRAAVATSRSVTIDPGLLDRTTALYPSSTLPPVGYSAMPRAARMLVPRAPRESVFGRLWNAERLATLFPQARRQVNSPWAAAGSSR